MTDKQKEEKLISNEDITLLKTIVMVDGVELHREVDTIAKQYSRNEIDYEIACRKIEEILKKEQQNE